MFNRTNKKTIKTGEVAPAFTLCDQSGKEHTLDGYRGKWLIIYFYPKDDTPGCTKEACLFRDEYQEINSVNTEVLGISVDRQTSHSAFAAKYQLPFPLLADTTGEVARSFQSLRSFGPIKFAKRHSFIIDPDSKLRKVYRKVTPAKHTQEIIRDLKLLQQQKL